MIFYTALRGMANSINNLRGAVFSMAASIRNVWLIGDNLYTWFATISAYLSLLANLGYSAASDWLTTYNELRQASAYIPGLSEILYYLDDILSLVRDFDFNVDKAIARRFPNLHSLNLNPVSFVLQVIANHTGLSQSFLQNPISAITEIVNASLGDLKILLANPYAYIVSVILRGNPLLYHLFIDPRQWLRSELGNAFPHLSQFFLDPGGFILARISDTLENTIETFGVRMAKLAEKIINFIF